jgi:alpha-tubulin suppressor-like RCC1 family protein
LWPKLFVEINASAGPCVDGQLGQGDTEAQRAPVQLGGDIVGKFITSVSCGCSHCVALDADGNVYAWGKNNHGQLGTGNYDNKLIPTLIPHLSAYNVTQANAGCHFTLLFTNSSEIWGFGVNVVRFLCM